MHTEVELALCLPAGQQNAFIRRVEQLFPGTQPARRQELLGIYYDTPTLDLAQQRMGLRLRKQGNDWIQTIKFAPPAAVPNLSQPDLDPTAPNLHRHTEIEYAVAAQALELHRIEHVATRHFLMAAHIQPHLQPVFETHICRTLWHIAHGASLVELALDVGTIQSGKQTMPVSEIELEIKRGTPEALFAIARVLQKEFALTPQPHNKARRGYHMLSSALRAANG